MSSATYLAPGVYVEEVPSAQQPIAGVGTNVVGFIGIVPSTIYIPVPNPDYNPVAARAAARLSDLADAPSGGPEDPRQAIAAAEAKSRDLALLDATLKGIEKDLKDLNDQLAKATTDAKASKDIFDSASRDAKAATDALAGATDANRDELTDALEAAKAKLEPAMSKNLADADGVKRLKGLVRDKQTEQKNLNDRLIALKGELAPPTPPTDTTPGEAEAPSTTDSTQASKPVPKPARPPRSLEKEDDTFEDAEGVDVSGSRSVLQPFMLQEFTVKPACFETKLCTNFTEYTQRFGTFSAYKPEADFPDDPPETWTFSPMHPGHHALTHAVNGFFQNGGTKAFVARIENESQLEDALAKFASIDELAIIAAPGVPRDAGNWEFLMAHVENRENCFAILDSPLVVHDEDSNDLDVNQLNYASSSDNQALPRPCKNAAFYFPHVEVIDPAKQLQDSDLTRKVDPKYRGRTYVAPSGHVAGIYARTDTERGVHKAPANCVVRGAIEVKYYVSKPIQEMLNPQGVNAIRIMNGAVTVWGARTIGGDRNSEWKYISVRRLFLFLQKSIEEGTQWIVFEPNDEALWAKIRLNVSAFLTNVWRSGALFGATPQEAFYVKCDAELNPPEVRDQGLVITEIGVAIVRPAEFVVFRITQATGPIRT
ncbi:phage tail sheath C-terminal domain-containing protein [Paraburkholderia sp. GAS334]|uniref:phage tail sheath family protein n=1 Tax=Paraburkholderia sp. GAS334 TaxID=3035131 RepID=UPI003D1FF36E